MLLEPSVDEQRGEAMDDGPCGHGEHHRIAAPHLAGRLGLGDGLHQQIEGARAGLLQGRVGRFVGNFRAEHHAQIRGMREGELHVADPECVQTLARVGDAGADHHHALSHLHEAPLGYRREKGLAVREVPVRRGLGHVGPPGDLAEAEALRSLLGDQRRRRLDERIAQTPGGLGRLAALAEFLRGGKVVGREVVTIVPASDVKQVAEMRPPPAGSSRVEVLKGGDYLRVWINRGGNQYLIHFNI